MSKGSPIVRFRLPPDVLAWIDEAVAKSEQNARDEPYTRSSWVRAAIMERFAKYQRAKEAQQRAAAAKKGKKPSGEQLHQVHVAGEQLHQVHVAGEQLHQVHVAGEQLHQVATAMSEDQLEEYVSQLRSA